MDRRKRFVEEYLVDLNASQAGLRSGYKGRSTGCNLLKDPRVRQAVDEAIRRRSEGTLLRQADVVLELGRIAFADASDASGSDMKYTTKLRALELLGKHLGMFDGGGGDGDDGVLIVDDLGAR